MECRSPGRAAAQRVKDRYAELTRRMAEKVEKLENGLGLTEPWLNESLQCSATEIMERGKP